MFREDGEGLRIITDSFNQLLVKVPEAYQRIFTILSPQPGAQLYHAFESF